MNPPLSSTFPHYKINDFLPKVKKKTKNFRYFLKRWNIKVPRVKMVEDSGVFRVSYIMWKILNVALVNKNKPSRSNITPATTFNLLTVEGLILCLFPVINLNKV